jgi:ABC-type branched-subunit amino acid transport system ATPase component/ABC-type branched-subunit amino acid transport system permease subunit
MVGMQARTSADVKREGAVVAPTAPPIVRRVGPFGWLVLLAVMVALPWLGIEEIWVRIAIVTAIYGMISSGLNLTFGWAGEVSFAQVALFAFGAYVAAVWSNHGQTNLFVLMVVAGIGAGILGGLTALPGLRLGSWALAITSFLLVVITPDVLVIFQNFTGGNNGLPIPPPHLFGLTLGNKGFYVLCIAVAAVWVFFYRNLVTSRHGHALLTLRESPVLASALGININRTKILVYALAGVPAGVAGVLFVFLDLYVSPPSFGLTTTLGVIAASVVGGTRSVLGPFVATAVLMGLPIWSASLSQYSLLASGGLLVIAGLLSVTTFIQPAFRRVLPARFAWLAGGLSATVADSDPAIDEIKVDLGTEAATLASLGGSELSVRDLTVRFGGVTAVSDVSLSAKPGEITALIGPNGSGKTSLLNLISGFYQPSSGHVVLGNTDITKMGIAHRAKLGVSRTFQTPLMPPYATVHDVVTGGMYTKRYVGYLRAVFRTPAYRRALGQDEATALECLTMLGIPNTYSRVASSLPLGTRRLVELARVMVSQPKVILLDEPASGLSPEEVRILGRVLSTIRDHGATIVLVEHNFRMIQSLADTIVVLDQGRLLARGSVAEIQANEEVARIYLGMEPRSAQVTNAEPEGVTGD